MVTILAQNPTWKVDQPISFKSWGLNLVEQNYSTMEHEALAMIFFLDK